MDLPEKTKLAATFSVCSILAAMGDRAANQAAHNRWIRERVQVAMKELPDWDKMSEADQYLFTTVVEASCGIHAICNIATAGNKELARCEKLLRKMKPQEMAKMTEQQFDLLFHRNEDNDVDENGSGGTDSEIAASHLVARCTQHDIDFSHRSLSWTQFVENQELAVIDGDSEGAMMLGCDTIDGISAELNLPVAELASELAEQHMADGISVEETIMGSVKNANSTPGFVPRRNQCAAEKYLYEAHKCFTLTTEYENQLGMHMRAYEDLHMEPYMYRDFKRLVGSRYFIYQMNAPIGYAVIGHTLKAVEFYEDGQESRTGRRKLVQAVLDSQNDIICQAELRALSVHGAEASFPMLTALGTVENVWAANAHFDALDKRYVEWLDDPSAYFAGEMPLFMGPKQKEARYAIHEKYMMKVRESNPTNDALTAAFTKRLLIQGRKTLHRHKAEQLSSKDGHLTNVNSSVVDSLSHMQAHNNSSERIHGLNNHVRTSSRKPGMRNGEGLIMAPAYDLMGLIHSGEISDSDLELAAKLYREHVKKHGSQSDEEKKIDDKHKGSEDKRRDDRQKATKKKEAARAEAEAATLIVEANEIKKFSVIKCKDQLRAWAAWLVAQGVKIGSKPGQVDCLLKGNRGALQGKLCKVIDVFRAKAIADNKAVSKLIGPIKPPKTIAVHALPPLKGVKYKLCEDEGEEHHGRISAADKWGEDDPDCTVVSSGSFA